MTDLNLDAIEAAARAATQGEWRVKSTRTETGVYAHTGNVREHITAYVGEADARHVASASPAVVLELVRRVRESEGELARINIGLTKMVADMRSTGKVDMRLSGCEWCGAVWPHMSEQTANETKHRARRHAYECAEHPMRAEIEALREQLERSKP